METGTALYMTAPPMPFYLIGGKDRYAPGQEHPDRYALGVFDMLLVKSGVLRMAEEGRSYDVGAGQALILRPDLHHYPTEPCGEETHFYWLHFFPASEWRESSDESLVHPSPMDSPAPQTQRARTGLPSERTSTIVLPKHGTLPSPGKTFDALEQLLLSERQPQSSALWQQQAIFFELVKDMHRGQKTVRDTQAVRLAEQAEAFLKQNYRNPVTNAMLGEALHFHPNYISRCMQKVTGYTPIDYLIQYRLEQAKLLLMKTELSVMRIAEEVGFHQPAYFSRCFSRKEGITPLQFRKKFMK
ncbi:AraC family transcriptional regulator [Paenibacillus hodogayensis]|uniref:AraC family transcriptional regulator n=1 Tax=Paenibacillus hodogayensis TaxID=279208 RepID=A0ABV5W1H5_9BACL